MSYEVDFLFRVWVYVQDGDSPDIEIWYHGLEKTDPATRFVSDWIAESFENYALRKVFDLDPDKNWQVVGKGKVHVYKDYFYDEYDEQLEIVEFEKQEVTDSYIEYINSFGIDEQEDIEGII